MRLLIVTQYFWPEHFVINDVARCMGERGIEVDVLTGKPNYPDGHIYPGYTQQGTLQECYTKGVAVHRVPLTPRKNAGSKNLIINYLSFVFNGLRYAKSLLKQKKYAGILVFAPSPITSAIPGIYLKWRYKTPLYTWVQDLWPESLAATGHIRNPIVLWIVGRLVKAIYSNTDTLLLQSEAFRYPITKYASPEKLIYFPNPCVDLLTAENTESIDGLPSELVDALANYRCYVFAGNIGTAQSVETLTEAARLLSSSSRCRIVLVGSGSMSHWVASEKRNKKLDNLILVGRLPSAVMGWLFSKSEGLLVTLKDEPVFAHTIPSKIQAYLSSGRPIIAAINGEGARIIDAAGAGLTCPSGDAQKLADCIEKMTSMTEGERYAMGHRGRAFFLKHFEIYAWVDKFVALVRSHNIKEEQ